MPPLIFPEVLDEESVESKAEVEIYKTLRAGLDSNYVVIHGVRWTPKVVEPGDRADPEVDFLILRTGWVILCMEVKGGQITISGHQWYQNGRGMKEDPFRQAITGKHGLIQFIRSQPQFERAWVPIECCLAFPHTAVNPARHIVDRLVLCRLQLDDIGRWVNKAMECAVSRQLVQRPLTSDMTALVVRLFAEGRSARMSEKFERQEREFAKLTERQYRLLSIWRNQQRAVAAGCAGSGKTFLAIEKAKRLSAEGKSVFLTCQNPELASYLRVQLAGFGSVVVNTFQGMCHDLADRAGYALAKYPENADLPSAYLDLELPTAMDACIKQLLAQGVDPRFHAIIVDEAQMFKELWWSALDELLVDGDKGVRYIFYDNNQRIYDERDHIPGEEESFVLDENCRNTQQIHWATIQFYRSYTIPACSRVEGVPVEAHEYQSLKEMLVCLVRILRSVIIDEGVSAKDVIVLTPRPVEASVLFKLTDTKLGPFRLSVQESSDESTVRFASIGSFRGLERKVVILVEIDGRTRRYPELLYIGMSRPRDHLGILYASSVPVEVKEQIALCTQQSVSRD